MSKLIDPQHVKNLVLDLTEGEISPKDDSLVILRGNENIPLMPNREIRSYNSSGTGKYINAIFNKNLLNSHMGLSFENIMDKMIERLTRFFVLDFLRYGDISSYMTLSYLNEDTQEYTEFNLNTSKTIYLNGTSFYMEIDSSNKTITFRRKNIFTSKSSFGARLSAVCFKIKFNIPAKMIIKEFVIPSGVETNLDISDLSNIHAKTVDIEGSNINYKIVPLDPKLIRASSYENFEGGSYDNRYLEGHLYDDSGILDIFKDSSRRNSGNNLNTEEPRWKLIREGSNPGITSKSKDSFDNDKDNTVNIFSIDSSFSSASCKITSFGGGDVRVVFCNIVLAIPVGFSYSSLPSEPANEGEVKYYIKSGENTYLLYSYNFFKDHKIGSIPYIPLQDLTEHLTMRLNDVTEINRDYNIQVGSNYSIYITAPYTITLVHNNREENTYLRVLNGVLPQVEVKTKIVGGSAATFKGYYSSSTGGTQYIDENGDWVANPTSSQWLYARWTQTLLFQLLGYQGNHRIIYKYKNRIEVTKNFVPDNNYLTGNKVLYYFTKINAVSAEQISSTYKGSLSIGSDYSYQDSETYDLSGGVEWEAYSKKLFIIANVSDVSSLYLLESNLLSIEEVSCNNATDETDGYTHAKASNIRMFIDTTLGTACKIFAYNLNNFNVIMDYEVYQWGSVIRSGSMSVPPGGTYLDSFSVNSEDIGLKLIVTQSWDSDEGDNAGKDSVYEFEQELENYSSIQPKTATPTVGEPYCTNISGVNYLSVAITNNDDTTATIYKGSSSMGTLAPGATASYILASGFNPPYTYDYDFSATAGGKKQSSRVFKEGNVVFCQGGL